MLSIRIIYMHKQKNEKPKNENKTKRNNLILIHNL